MHNNYNEIFLVASWKAIYSLNQDYVFLKYVFNLKLCYITYCNPWEWEVAILYDLAVTGLEFKDGAETGVSERVYVWGLYAGIDAATAGILDTHTTGNSFIFLLDMP